MYLILEWCMRAKCIDEGYFAQNVLLDIRPLRLSYMMMLRTIGLMISRKTS